MKNFKPKGKFSAIELDAKSIKLAQGTVVLGKPKLTALFFAKDLDLEGALIKDNIKSEFAKNAIEVDSCLICLPRQAVSTRYLKLPSQDEKEIEKMVKLQIPKLLPYASSEIVSSFKIINSDSAGFNYCIVVLAQQNLVRNLYSFLESIGIKPTKVILSSEGAVNLISLLENDRSKFETLILVDVDVASADIIIIREGQLVFTRSISRLNNETANELSWQNKLEDEINRSLDIANKEVACAKIDRLIFTGSLPGIRGLDKALNSNFPFPLEVISLVNSEIIKENLPAKQILERHDVSFASVIGAALSKDRFSLNLLPADIKDKLDSRQAKQERRKFLLLTALVITLLFGIFAKHIYDKYRLLRIIERKIKILSPQANTQEEISLRFETMREQLRQSVFTSDILKQVYNIIPSDVSLTNLNIEKDKALLLKGQTYKFSSVFNLINLLEADEYFKNVRLRYITKRKIRELELTDFQIDCVLLRK